MVCVCLCVWCVQLYVLMYGGVLETAPYIVVMFCCRASEIGAKPKGCDACCVPKLGTLRSVREMKCEKNIHWVG